MTDKQKKAIKILNRLLLDTVLNEIDYFFLLDCILAEEHIIGIPYNEQESLPSCKKIINEIWMNSGLKSEEIKEETTMTQEDKIRKEIIDFISNYIEAHGCIGMRKWLTWLEKQGQKPQGKTALEAIHEEKMNNANKVEPKFHKGDWVVCEITGSVYQIKECIENLSNYKYGYEITDGGYISSDEVNHYHLWTIADVKDGDVLSYNNNSVEIILLFEKWMDDVGEGAYSYAHTFDNKILFNDWSDCGYATHPATKEQCELLFSKMKEAGYEWDEEKKELKKIENEIEIPFSAKDSELQEVAYYIPKGFHAEIEGNNVVIKKGEQNPAWSEEDERMCQETIDWFERKCFPYALEEENPARESIKWLKSLKQRMERKV